MDNKECYLCNNEDDEICCEECIEGCDGMKCERCEKYVTDDMCVEFTYFNQIDFPLCVNCYEMAQF